MIISKNTITVATFLIIVILFLYFYGGGLVESIVREKINQNDWLTKNNFGLLPAVFTFGFGLLCGWLLFSKKGNYEKE
ncbi:MAG: hypothetical protein A2499_03425 [Stygiobacter sp. RIFOXYC12_FULL_38_8]|nr:MAG: hypothetical protein A2X62_07555 [Stygiobacter sp. GWC2_38_9]OGU83623.1 MAG: hypothetical protein A2279_11225 [Stygiobacter sp. RIFOXYA12_FULL_38_9]OGV09333.1 MAG: hypothetical protein A2299_15670 [Stygiobacter sp. RIFOXYB2_FULL_37_11]OGV11767.1 MAG: hypothetical protein A2237_08845 [Stygiobacter sp. RIFOXYA2_FULL_38_8]OGV16580.1 MAG: hypothetical protein A2440_02555 [Stygiobacter sp. RIFOXYC2_FULL_38_25]OGV30574.1 MAG: hypothetical protein A2499_03425 [Stygiobacter sp. RIFOXYC12_FULL_